MCDVRQARCSRAAGRDGRPPARKSGKTPPHLLRLPRNAAGAGAGTWSWSRTPDHWHALPMIAACQAGARRLLPEGRSASISARAKRCSQPRASTIEWVQIGLQRRSTPHLVEAKKRIVEGRLCWGEIGQCRGPAATTTCVRAANPCRRRAPQPHLDYEMWDGPGPRCAPYNEPRPPAPLAGRSWNTATASWADMCVHMLDAVRWMTGLGLAPSGCPSSGGIPNPEGTARPTSPTRKSRTFRIRPSFPVVLDATAAGGTAPRPGAILGPSSSTAPRAR